MKFRQVQIAGVVIKIGEVVVRLDVPRIVFQRKREVVESTRGLPTLEVDDAEVAISFSYVVAFADRFEVMFRGFDVALLV